MASRRKWSSTDALGALGLASWFDRAKRDSWAEERRLGRKRRPRGRGESKVARRSRANGRFAKGFDNTWLRQRPTKSIPWAGKSERTFRETLVTGGCIPRNEIVSVFAASISVPSHRSWPGWPSGLRTTARSCRRTLCLRNGLPH